MNAASLLWYSGKRITITAQTSFASLPMIMHTLYKYPLRLSNVECLPGPFQHPAQFVMIDHVHPRVNALKKCMGWYPVYYDVPQSVHPSIPARRFGGNAQPAAEINLGSFLRLGTLSPPNPLAPLGDTDAHITRRTYESSLVVMSVLCCLLLSFIISHTRSPKRKLPPHPRRIPIIGNLSQLADKKWLFSRECKEQFGEY